MAIDIPSLASELVQTPSTANLMPVSTIPVKAGIKNFYDAMVLIAIETANMTNPDKKGEKVTIAGYTYDFTNRETLPGTLTLADYHVQSFSQAIQFILKTDVTYINDLYKEASRLIG